MNRRPLLERLQAAADDPMWADHAEVPKSWLREAIEALTAAPAPEDAELVKEARKISPTLAEHWPRAARTLDRLADRLADRLSGPASGWCYDMEKAPRGKEFPILFADGHQSYGKLFGAVVWRAGRAFSEVPVAWFDLPAPPTPPGKEGQP